MLSWRQRQVVALVVKGKQNKEIAYELGLSEGTVRVYMSQLFVQLGVPNRVALAVWALGHPEEL